MRISDITIPNSAILLEANVLNIKDLYADVSVVAYASKYAEHIEDKALAKSFVVKFGKLMVNDDRWHEAVRNLPNDAPDWAKTAFNNQDLVFFHPNEQLNGYLDHITHYLEAVGAAAKNADPNIKIRAGKEKAAFLKVANFDEMVKRSNDWFIGSEKSKISEEGMSKITQTGPFSWFILQNEEAYKREGKIMQNCLGSHWTLAKAKKQDQSIVIMRKSNGVSVIAARIQNDTNEILEMKGKNNKAPIDEYMGGVLSLIRQRKLNVGNNAKTDFERAGYFSIQDKLYTRAEAIEKFLHKEKIGVVGDKQLVKISFTQAMAELLLEAYPTFKHELRSISDSNADEIAIYELRDGTGHADIAAMVINKEIMNVNRSERQADTTSINENASTRSSETLNLIEELFKRKIADRVNSTVNKNIFWHDKMVFNKDGKLEKTKHTTVSHSKKGHTWDHHTNLWEIHTAHANFKETDSGYSWDKKNTGLSTAEASNVKSYYITKHKKRDEKRLKRGHIVAMRTHYGHSATPSDSNTVNALVNLQARGKLFPHRRIENKRNSLGISTGEVSRLHDAFEGNMHNLKGRVGMKDHKTINSLMDLANNENLDLPDAFKINSGIQTDRDGKHTKHVLNPIILDKDGMEKKYNLSNIDNELNKLVAFENIATSLDVRPWYGEPNDAAPNPDHRANDLINNRKQVSYVDMSYHKYLRDDSHDVNLTDMRTAFYNKQIPDDIYTLSVKYGADRKHDIAMLVKDKEIYQFDRTTANHQFQHWGDHEDIADKINKFAADHGLTIKRRFLDRNNSKELRNGSNGITTASAIVKSKLENLKTKGDVGREGTDSLPLANGSKVVKLGNEEQADYLRQKLNLNSVPGQGWKVVDENGDVKGAFFVKKDKIVSIYTGRDRVSGSDASDLPSIKGFEQKMVPELKGAMKAFGWEFSNKLHFNVDTYLKTQSRRLLKMSNGKHINTTTGSDPNKTSQKLNDRGFIDLVRTQRLGTDQHGYEQVKSTWVINQKGKDYIKELEQQSTKMRTGSGRWASYNIQTNPPSAHFKHTPAASEVHPDYIMPEKTTQHEKKKKKPVPGAKETETATRSGTKSGQALDLFRQHVIDYDEMPSRPDFINILQDEPFNMSKAGASTYYANTKKKYSALNEKYSVLAALELMVENYIFLEDWI